LQKAEGFSGSVDDINIEKFLSFLDIEHYLELEGSDTWSNEGNLTQLMVRHNIGYILHDRMPEIIPGLYKQFASKLNPSDWVLTFNYDTLLEESLESIGTPYRLFPSRYSDIGFDSGTVDFSKEEVVILKMHGSIDWFDRRPYDGMVKHFEQSPYLIDIKHPLFGPDSVIKSECIVDGPRFPDDPLSQIFRVKNISSVYSSKTNYWEYVPLILNPSHTKLLYAKPLIEFWRGWGRSGGLNLGLGVIGYSLPGYDDYARQAIFKISQNFQGFEPDFELDGRTKQPVRILDYRPSDSAKADLHASYQFLDPLKTEYWYSGLTTDAINWFMS
jgi:hypothetical protein